MVLVPLDHLHISQMRMKERGDQAVRGLQSRARVSGAGCQAGSAVGVPAWDGYVVVQDVAEPGGMESI
jgi:hypothetical protein